VLVETNVSGTVEAECTHVANCPRLWPPTVGAKNPLAGDDRNILHCCCYGLFGILVVGQLAGKVFPV